MAQIELSVVVPVYNEVGNREALHQDIAEVLEGVALADRPALFAAILLALLGFQFITVGFLAELQTRAYHESKDNRSMKSGTHTGTTSKSNAGVYRRLALLVL